MDILVYGKGVYWLSIISWTTCNLHYMKLFKAGKIFNPKESNVPSKNPNFLPTPLMHRRKLLQFTLNDADLDPTSGQKNVAEFWSQVLSRLLHSLFVILLKNNEKEP